MSVTHRSLLALLLATDVWDLPLVVHRCYRCTLLLLPWSCVRRPSSVYCCNRWIIAAADNITALIIAALSLALALTITHH